MSTASTGVVLVGHGSHLNADSALPVFAHVDRIGDVEAFDEIRPAFWKEEPSPREVLRTFASDEIYVVPLFMSDGYFTSEVLPREFRLAGAESLDVDKPVHYTDPVGTHPAMARVIEQRTHDAIGDGWDGSGVGLAVVGHGTERNPHSAEATREHVDRLREEGRFERVHAFYMDESPSVSAVYDVLTTETIVVVPFFVADGYHTREDIPALLGIDNPSARNSDGSWSVDGRRVWYPSAVGTDPRVAAVAVERTRDAGAAVADALAELRAQTGWVP